MSISGRPLVHVRMPIEEIVAKAPDGEVPMFIVNVHRDEHLVGSHVYVKDGVVYDCITDRGVGGIKGDDLRFVRYIKP